MKMLLFTLISQCIVITLNGQCDDLEAENSEYGYRQRQGRCEGLYISNVNGFALQVVSLTQGKLFYASNSNEKLIIKAKPLEDFETISVRGANFGMTNNYRLDLQLTQGVIAEIPVNDVIEPNMISFDRLGVFGFVEKSGNKYYVPVMPMSLLSKKVVEENRLFFQLTSNIDLKTINWRYAVSENEICGSYSEINILPEKIYPRNLPFQIDIPSDLKGVTQSTIVCVQLNVLATNGLEFNENIKLLIPSP